MSTDDLWDILEEAIKYRFAQERKYDELVKQYNGLVTEAKKVVKKIEMLESVKDFV